MNPTEPAPELIDAGFALETAEAPLLHHGLGLADLAHVLDLRRQEIIGTREARDLLSVLLDALETPPEDFPYDPAYGELYNARERHFAALLGDTAGWLHAGRPRREAVRIAFRLRLRSALAELTRAAAELAGRLADLAAAHTETWMADQTYLQHAQPSTFGHYVLSFADPALRDGRRLLDALDWADASPGGAGCVNGSRLLPDRGGIAELLGFASVIDHTRDAMWQIDVLIDMVATSTSLLLAESKLAEDLEIWASNEYDYITLAQAYTRASVLMPQKRNPYSLAIIRGAAGQLTGRLAGLLAVSKTPSARSDNYIFSYGEVPRALESALRTTRLTTGVISSLQVNQARLWNALEGSFAQATDLTEHLMQTCGIDYRSAYRVVGHAVREASSQGLRGCDLEGQSLDSAAMEVLGHPLGLANHRLDDVLDPRHIVRTRTARGGAAPGEVARMATDRTAQAEALREAATARSEHFARVERSLVETARQAADPSAPTSQREGS
jgi:argininosuccinate lyase